MAQTRKAPSGSSASARRSSGGNRSAASRRAQRGSTDGADASSGAVSTVAGAIKDGGRNVVKNAAFPIASAMAGAAVGMAFGRRHAKRRKKVLGLPIPGTGAGGTDGLAKSVGEASKQIARLADEVRTGRKKAEEIGKALS